MEQFLQPFGKRSGRMVDNRILYKQFLIELGRVSKLSTGRIVLLTYDRRSLNMVHNLSVFKILILLTIDRKKFVFLQALQTAGDLFQVTKMLGVNIGGLQAAVYVLKRSDVLYDRSIQAKSCKVLYV